MTQTRQEHFYDGWLYHVCVDPALRKARKLLRRQIKPQSSLIDIGCGTGELVISLSDSCSELVGVETSQRMWSYAQQRALDEGLTNVRIIFAHGTRLADFPDGYFDYATACMVFHEMDARQRLPVLKEMKRLAGTLILVDYRLPMPVNLAAFMCRSIERLAGRHHYRNYRSFLEGGGLIPLVETLELTVQQEVPFYNRCLHLLRSE
jgi:demethylmenaquinone methyltransferase/2-methoxy-6-polyprenyl-1,4-benzoquinol methylase